MTNQKKIDEYVQIPVKRIIFDNESQYFQCIKLLNDQIKQKNKCRTKPFPKARD